MEGQHVKTRNGHQLSEYFSSLTNTKSIISYTIIQSKRVVLTQRSSQVKYNIKLLAYQLKQLTISKYIRNRNKNIAVNIFEDAYDISKFEMYENIQGGPDVVSQNSLLDSYRKNSTFQINLSQSKD